MEKADTKKNKPEKAPKPYVKFIWLAAAVGTGIVGFYLRTHNPDLPFAVGAVVSVIMMAFAVIASQYQSTKRQKYAEVDEEGKKLEKGKYFAATVVYYLFIIAAVIMLAFSFWICGIVSV